MKDGVSVVVRVRQGDEDGAIRCNGGQNDTVCDEVAVVSAGIERARFTFDSVLTPSCSQREVFDTIGADVVNHVLEGYNACILTYGQTASGKTYSMIGPEGGAPQHLASRELHADVGLIPRILEKLLSEGCSEVTKTVELSCVELYNEVFFDLLRNEGTCDALRIREDRTPGGKGIFIEGARSETVSSFGPALEVLGRIAALKHTSSTAMNSTSSRSHTIVMVSVDQVDHLRHDAKTSSRMFLVDLAGSERIEKTGAVGDRLKEAQTINLSLTLLGNVIKKLTDNKSMHIPYRDSKLTRLLQDSLGGNSLTTLLCTVSPETLHTSETISTLTFAQRAKCIRNRPVVNKVLCAEEYAKEVAYLRLEVSELQEKLRDYSGVLQMRPKSEDSESVEAVQDALTSTLHEVYQLKEELREAQRASLRHEESAKFHQEREKYQAELAAKWEERYRAENATCSAAINKLESLFPTASSPLASAPTSHTPTPTRTAQVQLQRRVSCAGAQEKQGKVAVNFSEPSPVILQNRELIECDSQSREAQVLVRERMLLSQVDKLQDELSKMRKFSVMCDQLIREMDDVKNNANNRIDAQEAKYGELLRSSEETILGLRSKLEESHSSHDIEQELAHLRMENGELHSENRANAGRLLDFTKRIDGLTKEVNSMKDDRTKLATALEAANIDATIKQHLLSISQLNGIKDRSYFRKKLLECFSSD